MRHAGEKRKRERESLLSRASAEHRMVGISFFGSIERGTNRDGWRMNDSQEKKKRPAVASAFWHFFRRSRRQLYYYYYYYDGERRRNESIENIRKRISCVRNWRHCLLFLNLNLFGIHHLSSAAVQNFLIIYFLFNLVLVLLLGIIKI